MPSSLTTETHPPSTAPDWRPRFFTLWAGQACSLLGSQLVQFALIWHLATTGDSATALAVASLIGLVPQVLLSPLIGALVDRWDRRTVLVAADGLVAAATLALAALFTFGRVEIWHIYALLLARALGGGFHTSAWGASVVLLVPRQHLSRVQGLNQALRGGMDIAAAPLGALLLSVLPMQGVLAIDVATALLAVAPLLYIPLPRPERQAQARASVWGDIVAGARYVLGWPGLLIILVMAALINLVLTPAAALLHLLVTRHFRGGALELGWLSAASGAGMVLGGALLGAWGGFRSRVVTAMLGLFGLGAGTALTGAAPAGALWLALGASLAAGLATPIVNGSLGAAIQAAVAPEMQGRVFALVLSAASAMAPLGLLVAGPLSDAIGVRVWFWAGGAVCALMGAAGLLTPAVRRLEAPGRT